MSEGFVSLPPEDEASVLAGRPSGLTGAAGEYFVAAELSFGYCLSRLGGREDAEDATQLTFLHAVRGLRRGIVPQCEDSSRASGSSLASTLMASVGVEHELASECVRITRWP